MQTRNPIAGHFLVNGTKCELKVDGESISWTPLKSTKTTTTTRLVRTSCEKFSGGSDSKHRGTKTRQKYQVQEQESGVNSKCSTIEFNHVIGVKCSPEARNIINPIDKLDKIHHHHHHNHQDQDNSAAEALRSFTKLKVYYARQATDKSTGKLLKLKKLTLESLNKKDTTNIFTSRQQKEIQKQTTAQTATKSRLSQSLDERLPSLATDDSVNLYDRQSERQQQQQHPISGPPSYNAIDSVDSGSSSCSAHLSSSLSTSSDGTQATAVGARPLASSRSDHQVCTTSTDATANPISCNDNGTDQKFTLNQLAEQMKKTLEIKRQLQWRPKRLLVFVNPYGGKGKATKVFKTRVSKLMELAQIEVKLVITQYANHARDTIEDPQFNVEYFDGIICIGGDGMFSELMNGLLFRYNREQILATQLPSLYQQQANGVSSATRNDSDYVRRSPAKTKNQQGHVDYDNTKTLESDQHRASYQQHQQQQDPSLNLKRRNSKASTSGNLACVTDRVSSDNYDNKITDLIITTSKRDNNDNHIIGPNRTTKTTSTTASNVSCRDDMQDDNTNNNNHYQLDTLRLALGGIGRQFVSPPIPIGVIGAGSTDANSFGLIGTNDVITATLNIILGNQIDIDVCSIHSIREDRPMRFVSTFVAYGYFGDVIRESERMRWLGPSRYDVTGINNLIKNRTYQGKVRLLRSKLDGSPMTDERCHADCQQCWSNSKTINLDSVVTDKNVDNNDGVGDELELLELSGPFVGVNAAVTACRCPQTKKGFSPSNHLANGCADLIVVRPCSRMQYIQYLLRTGWTKKSAFDLKYVDAYRCRQFEFYAQPSSLGPSTGIGSKTSSSTSSAYSSASSTASSSSVHNNNRSSARTLQQYKDNSNSLESTKGSGCGFSSTLSSNVSDISRSGNSSSSTTMTSKGSSTGTGFDPYADGSLSSWNVDGEIFDEQSIRVKVNNQLLRVYGTGEPLM